MITAKEAKENTLKARIGKDLPDAVCSALVLIELESKRGNDYVELLDIVYSERIAEYFTDLGFTVSPYYSGIIVRW